MITWSSKSLGDGVSALIYTAEIEQIFQPLFEAEGCPAEMAIFTRQEPREMHCEIIAYFSPAARKIARKFSAQPCNPPNLQGLELLAGSLNCWQVLFQE